MPAEMTGRERILAAMRGEMPDRVPVSPRIGYYLQTIYGLGGWLQHVRAAREFGFDLCVPHMGPVAGFIFSPQLAYPTLPNDVRVTQQVTQEDGGRTIARTFETPAGPLTDITFQAPSGREYGLSPSPVKHEHLIKDADDLERLRYILPWANCVDMREFHEIDAAIGNAGILEMTMNPPLDHYLGEARGLTQLMMDYYLDRPLFDAMFAFFQEYALELLKAALEQGVRHVFGTWYYASMSAGWSPAMFAECFVPLMRQQSDLVHAYGGIYHAYDDGKMMANMANYCAGGADVVETLTPPPVGDLDLAAAKAEFGDRICLKGHVDLLYVLKMGTVEDVVTTVRNAMEVGKPGGRFILGTSDSMREGTPAENVRAYFETARRHGAY
jgi:uroporphyrinogen decarboxylase